MSLAQDLGRELLGPAAQTCVKTVRPGCSDKNVQREFTVRCPTLSAITLRCIRKEGKELPLVRAAVSHG